ncbi:MAG TPA: hypothetical protein VL326_07195 [Kofleriaceae bacterium]|nr:hypothetical protein [Kofleriaceae bacterium]
MSRCSGLALVGLAQLVALAACSSPAHPKTKLPPTTPKPDEPVSAPLAAAPIPVPHKLRDAPEAPHGGLILDIATSPDGVSAVSVDELGGIRLWPTLDGKQEPRVIDLPAPKQMALVHRADGFTVVALDEVGGIYIAKLDKEARALEHVTLAPDPAYLGIVMTDIGLLAWRADQTIVTLGLDGAMKARITTHPKERVVDIGASGNRAVAITELEDGSRSVRWLDLVPKLAWGDEIYLGGDPGQEIVLSPKHTFYAIARLDEQKHTLVQVVNVAKKRVVASTTVMVQGVELAFIDDDTLAIGTFEGISWIDTTMPMPVLMQVTRTSGARVSATLAAAGGKAVTTQNGELVLATITNTEFLGYDLIAPRFVEAANAGQLLVGVKDTFTFLDAKLEETSTSTIALPANNVISQLLWLGGDDWLAETAGGTTNISLSVFDVTKSSGTVVRSNLKEANVLMFEPRSNLVTLSFGAEAEVAKWDPATRQLTKLASIAKPSAYEQELLAPLDPKLANGLQLVHVVMRDRPTIKWLRDAHSLSSTSSTVTIDGSYAGADAAGHVFLWRNSPSSKLELAVYADGKPIAQLPAQGPVSLWPAADGQRVLEIAANSIGLYGTTDGKQLWTQELSGVQEAIWLTDGSLAITSAGGIARLDGGTGAITSARCGWRFGLTATQHPQTSRIEPLCAQRAIQ